MKTALAALAIIGGMFGPGIVHPDTGERVSEPTQANRLDPTRSPCKAEDGPGPCYWDAGKRGNHRGASYWIDGRQVAHYVDGVRIHLH